MSKAIAKTYNHAHGLKYEKSESFFAFMSAAGNGVLNNWLFGRFLKISNILYHFDPFNAQLLVIKVFILFSIENYNITNSIIISISNKNKIASKKKIRIVNQICYAFHLLFRIILYYRIEGQL